LLVVHSLFLNDPIISIAIFVCVPLIAILISEPEFERTYRYYLIEEENVGMVEGIFSKKKLSIPYDQIASIKISKSILGRILKFGDVNIAGVKSDIVMKGIRKPDEVFEMIQEKIKLSKKRKKV
jgi:uncharacterized membrane protein YdbT with pleckstrin-like domain